MLFTYNNYILDVRMEKEQKPELGWRVSVLPIPAFHCIVCTCKTITSNKNFILKYLDVGMEKNRSKNWDGGYLYYPFLHSTVHCVHATYNGSQWWNAGMGNTDTLYPNSCFCSFPSLHLKYYKTNFLIS